MKYLRTYIKQSENSVVAHIYEHIVANQAISDLYNKGLFRLLDYELVAENFDGIIVIRVETYDRKTLGLIDKLIHTATFGALEIKNAIGQIEAEYKRKGEFDLKKLTGELRMLDQLAWTLSKDLVVTNPITKLARQSKTNVGGFTRSAKREFTSFEIVYTIEDLPFELKTIAIYLLQIVGFIQIDGFYLTFKQSYDTGDEWAEYQELVGYLHNLTVSKDSKVTLEKVEKQFARTLQMMNSDGKLLKKIHKYINRSLKSEYPYFSLGTTFANAYQITGDTYLSKYNSIKNIAAIIKKIDYEIN
jgi:hypothetical protein